MNIKDFIQNDRFAKLLGIELIEAAPGHFIFKPSFRLIQLPAIPLNKKAENKLLITTLLKIVFNQNIVLF